MARKRIQLIQDRASGREQAEQAGLGTKLGHHALGSQMDKMMNGYESSIIVGDEYLFLLLYTYY